MQQTIQILPCIDKFPKPNQDTLGVGSSEKKQTSWECNRAINCRVFRLKLKENIDSDQNKIHFISWGRNSQCFPPTQVSLLTESDFSQWLWHSRKCQWQSQETGQDFLLWIRCLGLDSHSCRAVRCLCPAVGVQSRGGGKSPIFSALWRIMKYLVAHGGWEHLGILGVMALPAGAGILLLLVRVSPRWLSRREVWGDQRHLQACPVGERQNPAQMPNVLQELSLGVSDRTAPTLQVPRTSLVQRP